MSSITYYKTLISRPQKNCRECKYFKDNICTVFKFVGDQRVYFAKAEYCRNDEYLCGPRAKYYEKK